VDFGPATGRVVHTVPVPTPSRHICVLTLLVALLPLAGCGSDPETDASATVGETVAARAGVDTEGAPKGHLLLPSGRLDIRAGEPVESIPEDATSEREARTAPDGGVFLPLTWTFRTGSMARLVPLFGRPLPIRMTLISGGERYALAPPTAERDGEGVDAYYLAVDGTGEQAVLEVEYAGVTQRLDLVDGGRDEGRASALYGLDTSGYDPDPKPCPSDGWIKAGPTVQVTFSCTSTDAVQVPFVDGQWAPKGRTFAVVGLTSNLSLYTIYGAAGGGATYTVRASKDRTELAGARPSRVLDEVEEAGTAAGYLVFELKGAVPRSLDFRRSYQLQRSTLQGDVQAPPELKLEIAGTIPLR
jgi:hypothetical protein